MHVWEIYAQAVSEFKARNFDAALNFLDEVKRREPGYRKAYLLEAYVWRELKNFVREFHALSKLMPLFDLSTPEQRILAGNALSLFAAVCRVLALPEESVKLSLASAELSTDNADACSELDNAFLAASACENFSADDFRTLNARYKKYLSDIAPYPKKFYDHRKIRVGFLSADFKQHVVTAWSRALLTGLDKNFFAVYCYSSTAAADAVTEQIRAAADVWRDIAGTTDAQAAEVIRADEIDILFDLGGHTSGNRLRVAAYRPATVQVSGVGYMSSTGLDAVDYFLSDVNCAGDAVAMREAFSEKIIILPQTHICYAPPVAPEIFDAPPCRRKGFVTFGSFNQFGKVTDSILRAWKKILDAVPNSRLLLKNRILDHDDGKIFVGERLKNFGVDPARVEMRGFTTNHLAEYRDVDIALDTFPYVGGVTTCEALYMGVPVVSLYGKTHGTRFGLSILANVGLGELAVDTLEKYIWRAVALAGDWELLGVLRQNLRGMMKRSPLMDESNYARVVAEAFAAILRVEREFRTDRDDCSPRP